MSRIYRQIGFGGLWNGLGTRIVAIGTLTGLQWLIYDTFKLALGVSSLLIPVLDQEDSLTFTPTFLSFLRLVDTDLVCELDAIIL